MVENKAAAADVRDRLLSVNATLDETVVLVMANGSVEEVDRFKQAVGEIIYKVFDEVLIPIYQQYPDLIPAGQRVSGITD